jgi:PASTA domain/FecR protein
MNASRTQSFLPAVSRLIAIALSLAATDCATTSRFATLEGVIKDERPASGRELQLVQIEREGRTKATLVGMPLTKADRIVTAAGVKAVITFEDGWEVTLEPGSELEILNPSIFLRIGSAIVTKLREFRATLQAHTEYTVAAPEGTLFKIEVRGEEVTYKVVEGRLRVSSQSEAWAPVVLGPLEQSTAVGSAPPERAQLDQREADAIRREARRADDILRPEVPAVVGKSLEEAQNLLAAAGFKTGDVVDDFTGRRPVGTVLEQTPKAGVRLRVGGRVRLVVEAESVIVPDLLGLTRENAQALLGRSRLATGAITEALVTEGQDGTVTEQSPAADTRVAPGTRVDLTILRVGVEVPNVLNLRREQAEALLWRKGLRPSGFEDDGSSGRPAYTVIHQSPAPGTIVDPGSEVTFIYARLEPPG